MHLFYTLVLALSVVPIPSISAGPTCASKRAKTAAACTESWGWPGFVKGTNPWGNVLSPSASHALSSALSSACASTASSTASGKASSVSIKASSTTVNLSSTLTVVPLMSTPLTSATLSKPTMSSPSANTVTQISPSSSSPSSSSSIRTTSSSTTNFSTPPKPSTTSSVSTSSPASSLPTSSLSVTAQDTSNSDISTYLSTHNTVRAAHGASPLSWNNTLAGAAQKWANGCVFQHSGGKLGPFGENLAAGTGSVYGITSAVQSWTNEASQYNPSSPVASHFTQVVWKATTQLGCAVQSCNGIFPSSFGPAKYFRFQSPSPSTMSANFIVVHYWLALVLRFAMLFVSIPHSVYGAITWSATPFNPAAVPLAVRTPYLSCWLAQGPGAALNDVWPSFWTNTILGWAGFVRVDNIVYSFLGAPAVQGATFSKAVQKSMEFTATQSTFVLTAGPVDLTATFLSPVEPKDLVRQSLPFSYLSLTAAPNDGNAHSVQVYTDISAEWITGDNSLTANWTTSVGDVITHQVQLVDQTEFSEISDHIQRVCLVLSIQGQPSNIDVVLQSEILNARFQSANTTYQTGQDIVVRAQFINNGVLENTEDSNFRAVSDNWPVFAFAEDLGEVTTSSSSPVVFSVGHFRDPTVEYIIANDQLQMRSPYFLTAYSTVTDAVSFFLGDFSNAVQSAKAFDSQIFTDAEMISSEYAAIVQLSVRQAFGATEITVSKNSDGTFNSSDILIFMKEISSDGNVNTVDVIFPSWPIFLYTNPELGRYLLEGLFRYQATGQYPNKYSAHDLGTTYPQAVGHNDGKDEPMPVEESGNMLIMTLSYTQATGDNFLINTYFDLLDQWTQFLINDSLIPANQISTDDFAGSLANQTNLAIKGLIGIKAMSVISGLLNDTQRESNYSSIASSYVTQWQGFAIASSGDHLTLSYGNDSSWGLSYNLYGDKLLKTNLFPQAIYDMQTAWYKTVDNAFGVPLDTRGHFISHTYTKSDWQLWTASIMSETAVRDQFVSAVQKYAADGLSNAPLGDWYETTNGGPEIFRARPVVGGHLALLLVCLTRKSNVRSPSMAPLQLFKMSCPACLPSNFPPTMSTIYHIATALRQRLTSVVEYTDIKYALYSGNPAFPTPEYRALVRNALESESDASRIQTTDKGSPLHVVHSIRPLTYPYLQDIIDMQDSDSENIVALLEKYTTLSSALALEQEEPPTPTARNLVAESGSSSSPTAVCFERQDCSPFVKSPECSSQPASEFNSGSGPSPSPSPPETKCSFCTRTFKRSFDCKRHENTHTNASPYMCLGCGNAFKRSDARTRHWKKYPSCEQLDNLRSAGKRRRKRTRDPSNSNFIEDNIRSHENATT
ncbi:hypothetical protein EW145_g4138 [Phellinidium pouzarii]|uniref:C2H2-type domain-containing protein n=1 Tax=Phellinidium pouzarii TaxID=167371 RepID=A0A4S4L4T8_9AGAM|nr:hypothetical protein EW145_g4138 [Phellinidium pouzarii]